MASVCHLLPEWPHDPLRARARTAPTGDHHGRGGCGRSGGLHGLAGVHQARPGQPAHPRARARGGRGARLHAEPGGPRPGVGAHQHPGPAGPRHHQPLLRRRDQGSRARLRGGGPDPGARRHPGEPFRGGAADPPAGPCRGRLRPQRLTAARRGAAPGSRAEPHRPGQPGHAGARLRGRGLRQRHPPDRRSPRLPRAPVVRLPRRPGGVLVRGPPVGRPARRRRGARPADHQVRALRADPGRRPRGR